MLLDQRNRISMGSMDGRVRGWRGWRSRGGEGGREGGLNDVDYFGKMLFLRIRIEITFSVDSSNRYDELFGT